MTWYVSAKGVPNKFLRSPEGHRETSATFLCLTLSSRCRVIDQGASELGQSHLGPKTRSDGQLSGCWCRKVPVASAGGSLVMEANASTERCGQGTRPHHSPSSPRTLMLRET